MAKTTCVILGLVLLALGILGLTGWIPILTGSQVYVSIGEIILGGLGFIVGVYARSGGRIRQVKHNNQQAKQNNQHTNQNYEQQRKDNNQLRKDNDQQRKDNDQQRKDNDQRREEHYDEQKKEIDRQRKENK